MSRQSEKRIARVAQWKAEAEPYCILRLSKTRGYVPIRRKGKIVRYGSTHAALVETNRLAMLPSHRDHLLFVDFASAFEQAA